MVVVEQPIVIGGLAAGCGGGGSGGEDTIVTMRAGRLGDRARTYARGGGGGGGAAAVLARGMLAIDVAARISR